jgi:hypothetical protein
MTGALFIGSTADLVKAMKKQQEKLDDYIFRPSEQLSFYLYQMYLQVASCQELENDTLDVQTHWKLVESIGENDKGYEVFWDNNIAVTRDPAEENNKYKYDSSTGKFTIPKKNKSISSNSYMVWDEKENVWTTKENQRIAQEINDRIQMYGKSERYFNPNDPNDPFNGAIDLTKGNIPYDGNSFL